MSRSYSRTRSIQYPNEYESVSHTPKRNRKETPDFNIGIDQHPSKLSDNRQETAKISTAVTTASYFNINDDNTAFDVEPYLPPTRILRYYNCQVYDDHIAAHCPNKDNPVCFRCAQHHPHNPNCNNVIKCAHCQGDQIWQYKRVLVQH
ncbi:unnamed protein product [Rotaria sp. Silwood2]|nr:unnamed protein product [Rotaria sp. Silwood2]CAF2800978.1 unnamed protein product [Rotaria sp. Silwood2]CAF4459963.1 unnamed protein product [Rotaria sp. Silwood2]